ncbi:MAG: 4-alpha-glucanotransferase [Candidatus Humimicrobiaceae bacterium]
MDIFDKRKSGILLHITSLPSEFGIGDLGLISYKFAELLKKSGQSFWEILPINPTSISKGNSPYSTSSAFAGNTLLISPQLLYEDGIFGKSELKKLKDIFRDQDYVKYIDYKKVAKEKNKIFQKVFDNFKSANNKKLKDGFDNFCMENDKKWLDSFTLFNALRKKLNYISWSKWPDELKNFNSSIFLKDNNLEHIKKEKFLQFIFFRQWFNLKSYCNNLGIKIIGDIPIYVDFESSDVWANPEIFKLDKDKNPAFVSGVPPDYFSKTGQLWGNPVYDWNNLKKDNYKWWINRIEYNLNLFDFVRVDHFRGFVAYWEVPSGDKTAKNGKWVNAYPENFFNILRQKLLKKFSSIPEISSSDITDNLTSFNLQNSYQSDTQKNNQSATKGNYKSSIDGNHLSNMQKGFKSGSKESSQYNAQLNNQYSLRINFKPDLPGTSDTPNTHIDIQSGKSAIQTSDFTANNTMVNLPIIAENLGYITDDVEKIMKENNFPGLKVILFAFGKDFPNGTHLPRNYNKNCIAYTGTHDNNTIKGWFLKEAKNYEKKNILKYVGNTIKELNANSVNDILIRLIMSSAAGLTIIPVQDILGLESETRMNHPSTVRGNWRWRMAKEDLLSCNFKKLKEFTEIYSRV